MRANSLVKLVSLTVFFAGASGAFGAENASLAATGATAPDGAALFGSKCTSCHNASGKGNGAFPALAGNVHVTAKDPTAIIAVAKHGKGLMPAFHEKLSNAEIAAVITYIRSGWDNKAAAVSEAQVAAVH